MSQNDYRPDGLAPTPGVRVDYNHVYDEQGREKLANNQSRRTIGYFNGGRTGKDGKPRYLVSNIPWNKITHINYAFAHIDPHHRVSVGQDIPGNAATDMEWPGVPGAEIDPSLPYKGHFNLLTTYKKKHSGVRTLISVGGWAETGGILKPDGTTREATGGFYKLTQDQDTIDTFVDSVVDFLRTYGFDGVDIDYEYATSMKYAGNPDDYGILGDDDDQKSIRPTLVPGYVALMKTLRTELDRAAAADNKYYLLTAAVSGSPWVLRGSETYQVTQYLDYLNIMSYDLHGSWNLYVGPNAPLFDDGKDAELHRWQQYDTTAHPEYEGIGTLNTDWAYHYFRGAMPPGRINIGVPFYTRGWQQVEGGTNGLWGTAPLPDPDTNCPKGTYKSVNSDVVCGNGAIGIDNLWHDLTVEGFKVPAGVNPLWHAKNLEDEIQVNDYLKAYGLDPENNPEDKLTGTYDPHYDKTLIAPWLWNRDKKVFLSTETAQSIQAKAEYVVTNGIGGLMIWELAGDYAYDKTKNHYYFGTTLIDAIHNIFADPDTTPYGATKSTNPISTNVLDVSVDLLNFKLGEKNYPITPTMTLTNNSTIDIPGGATIEFDYGTSAPGGTKKSRMTDQSGYSLAVKPGHVGSNVGGLQADFHHATFTLPSWASIPNKNNKGKNHLDIVINYYLPITTPSNFKITFGRISYAITHDHPRNPNPILS